MAKVTLINKETREPTSFTIKEKELVAFAKSIDSSRFTLSG